MNDDKADTFRYFFAQPANIRSKCIFCRISDGKTKPGKRSNPSSLLYQDDRIVAFDDIHPGAPRHMLVVPVQHVKNCWSLTPSLLDDMDKVANILIERYFNKSKQEGQETISDNTTLTLSQSGNGNHSSSLMASASNENAAVQVRKFFIRPPWNSVYHVHLHVMMGPLTDSMWELRKIGFQSSWFHITPEELRKELVEA